MHRNNPLRWSKSLSDLHAKNINFWQNVLDSQVRLQLQTLLFEWQWPQPLKLQAL